MSRKPILHPVCIMWRVKGLMITPNNNLSDFLRSSNPRLIFPQSDWQVPTHEMLGPPI
jgi:hypothetical protein